MIDFYRTRIPVKFGNEMPRKGTETRNDVVGPFHVLFGNEMPRKGTETLSRRCNRVYNIYLEMRCPGRGRKLIFYYFLLCIF